MEMRKLIIAVIVLLAVLIGVNYFIASGGSKIQTLPVSEVELNQSVSTVVEEDYVRYSGRDGENAFVLLQEVTEVEFQQFDFGKFIQSINGVTPPSTHFWKLYINGQGAQVGAEDLLTKDGDVIEWRLEEIEGEV